MIDKNWFDALSEILSKPLPGTEDKPKAPADRPVVFRDEDDDDSLLDTITDILSRPLPGTEAAAGQGGDAAASPAEPENPGETAVREAEEPDADPVSTTAAAGADWMQREYERFNAHQERNRQAFAEQQRVEQERFAAYQRAQFEHFMKSQERERDVFRRHQEARFRTWRQDLRQAYAPPPGIAPPGFPPGMVPPPPPPWWRKR
jgi:hypothetical protein